MTPEELAKAFVDRILATLQGVPMDESFEAALAARFRCEIMREREACFQTVMHRKGGCRTDTNEGQVAAAAIELAAWAIRARGK